MFREVTSVFLSALDSLDSVELMGHCTSLEASYQDISGKRDMHSTENWGVRNSIVVIGLDTSLKEDEVTCFFS